MTTDITDRHCDEALEFIRSTIASRGYPPSRREITAHIGLASASGGQKIVDALVGRGLIEVDPGVTRGIRVVVGAAATEPM